jgi:hypothetical protein
MLIMRISYLLFAVFVLVAAPRVAHAQVPPLDSVQRAAMIASAEQVSKSAAFVLQHRTELALSATQLSALEGLAAAQRDSVAVRQARLVRQMQANTATTAMLDAMSWTGTVDEAGLREAACQQSTVLAEILLALVRDRRAAAALLTATQVALLPQLQMDDMLKAIQRP